MLWSNSYQDPADRSSQFSTPLYPQKCCLLGWTMHPSGKNQEVYFQLQQTIVQCNLSSSFHYFITMKHEIVT